MTLSELREYTSLKSDEIYYEVEITRLNNLKAEKVSYYTSPALDVIPGAGGRSGSTTENIALLNVEFAQRIDAQIKAYMQELKRVREKLEAIETFINEVNDNEVRVMLRRHIKQRVSFNQIAKEHFVSRNYVASRIKGVFKNE